MSLSLARKRAMFPSCNTQTLIKKQKEGAPLHCVCNYYAYPKLAQDMQKCSDCICDILLQ
jgi:hypothetical protein